MHYMYFILKTYGRFLILRECIIPRLNRFTLRVYEKANAEFYHSFILFTSVRKIKARS